MGKKGQRGSGGMKLLEQWQESVQEQAAKFDKKLKDTQKRQLSRRRQRGQLATPLLAGDEELEPEEAEQLAAENQSPQGLSLRQSSFAALEGDEPSPAASPTQPAGSARKAGLPLRSCNASTCCNPLDSMAGFTLGVMTARSSHSNNGTPRLTTEEPQLELDDNTASSGSPGGSERGAGGAVLSGLGGFAVLAEDGEQEAEQAAEAAEEVEEGEEEQHITDDEDNDEGFVTAHQSRLTSAALTAYASAASLMDSPAGSTGTARRLEQTAQRLAVCALAEAATDGSDSLSAKSEPLSAGALSLGAASPTPRQANEQQQLPAETVVPPPADTATAITASAAAEEKEPAVQQAAQAAGDKALLCQPVAPKAGLQEAAQAAESEALNEQALPGQVPAGGSSVETSATLAQGMLETTANVHSEAGSMQDQAAVTHAGSEGSPAVEQHAHEAAGRAADEPAAAAAAAKPMQLSPPRPSQPKPQAPLPAQSPKPGLAPRPAASPGRVVDNGTARTARASADAAAAEAQALLSEARWHLNSAFEMLVSDLDTVTGTATMAQALDAEDSALSDTASSRNSQGLRPTSSAADDGGSALVSADEGTVPAELSLPDSLGLGGGGSPAGAQQPAEDIEQDGLTDGRPAGQDAPSQEGSSSNPPTSCSAPNKCRGPAEHDVGDGLGQLAAGQASISQDRPAVAASPLSFGALFSSAVQSSDSVPLQGSVTMQVTSRLMPEPSSPRPDGPTPTSTRAPEGAAVMPAGGAATEQHGPPAAVQDRPGSPQPDNLLQQATAAAAAQARASPVQQARRSCKALPAAQQQASAAAGPDRSSPGKQASGRGSMADLRELEREADAWVKAREASWAQLGMLGSQAVAGAALLSQQAIEAELAHVEAEAERGAVPPAAAPAAAGNAQAQAAGEDSQPAEACREQRSPESLRQSQASSTPAGASLLNEQELPSDSAAWHSAEDGSGVQAESSTGEVAMAAAAAPTPGPLQGALLQHQQASQVPGQHPAMHKSAASISHSRDSQRQQESTEQLLPALPPAAGWAAAAEAGGLLRASGSPESQPLRFSLMRPPQSVERQQNQPLAAAAARSGVFGTARKDAAMTSAHPEALLPLHGRKLPVPASPLKAAAAMPAAPVAPAVVLPVVVTVASVHAPEPPSMHKQGAWEAQPAWDGQLQPGQRGQQQHWSLRAAWRQGAPQGQALPQLQAADQQAVQPHAQGLVSPMQRAVSVSPRTAGQTLRAEQREGLVSGSSEGSVSAGSAKGSVVGGAQQARQHERWPGSAQRLHGSTPYSTPFHAEGPEGGGMPGSAPTICSPVRPVARARPQDALRLSRERHDAAEAAAVAAEADLEASLRQAAELTPLSAIQALQKSIAKDPRWVGQRQQMQDMLGRLELRVREARERAREEAELRQGMEKQIYDLEQRLQELASEAEAADTLKWELLGARRDLERLQHENELLRQQRRQGWALEQQQEEAAQRQREHELNDRQVKDQRTAAEAAAATTLRCHHQQQQAKEQHAAAEAAGPHRPQQQQQQVWRQAGQGSQRLPEQPRWDESYVSQERRRPKPARQQALQASMAQLPFLSRQPTFMAPLALGLEDRRTVQQQQQQEKPLAPPLQQQQQQQHQRWGAAVRAAARADESMSLAARADATMSLAGHRMYHTYSNDHSPQHSAWLQAPHQHPPRQAELQQPRHGHTWDGRAPTQQQAEEQQRRLLRLAGGSSMFSPLAAGMRDMALEQQGRQPQGAPSHQRNKTVG